MRREVDELRQENQRLQDKLCKARILVVELQRQAEEAKAERDKEHRRAEGLHISAQQLQRLLKRETARTAALERVSATEKGVASANGWAPRSHLPTASFSVSSARAADEAPQGPGLIRAAGAGLPAASETSPGVALQDAGAHLATSAAEAPRSCANALASETGLDRSWEYVVQGQHEAAIQGDFAPKLVSCFPDDAVERARARGVACLCSRGRRLDDSVPNQDDFLVARHTLPNDGHIALYGVFDGHGPAGHHCAAFARGCLPESLFGQHHLLMRPEETLRQAFEHTHQSLLQQPFDTEISGTTVALALILHICSSPEAEASKDGGPSPGSGDEAWLFVAHVGDSRVVLASRREDEPSSFAVTALTRDHRPDDAEEAARVQRSGGIVRKLHGASGAYRVFAREDVSPTLALTRTLGASRASTCGVSSEPEVAAYRLRLGVDVLLLLGTDGLFEFCGHADAAVRLLEKGNSRDTLEDLCAESRQQWAKCSYNETVDDITAVSIFLPSSMFAT